MGGCYSANSAEAFKHSRERPFRKSGSKKNGKVEKESYSYGDKTASEDDKLIPATDVNINTEEKKEVVPSDSGIESLAPNSIKDDSELTPSHTEPVSIENKSCENDWYNTPSDNDVEKPPCENIAENESETIETYCSCGPRQAGNTSRHSNRCPTHMSSPKSNRNSDITGLKSSFKDFMRKTEKKVRLSWKSTDSLDINKQLCNHLDRAKSEQSEIFQDDISFCAPLAQFDSVGGNLDRPNSRNRMSTVSTASEIEAVARDICNCEFYANNLANELDVLLPERDESCPRQSPDNNVASKPNSSNKNSDTDSVYDNDLKTDQNDINISTGSNDGKETKEREPSTSLPKRFNESYIVKQVSLASLSSIRPSLSSLGDVTMTTYEGRDMVMIDVETYTQILEELQLLKTKLSQLTTIIQEDPVLDQAFQLMDSCQLNFEDSLLDNVDSETEE